MKFWTLMSGTSYIASISDLSYTHNPMQAVKYANIKMASIAANEWKRKYGLPVMVHVEEIRDYEDEAHSAFYSKNL
jgi:hypothetical protein